MRLHFHICTECEQTYGCYHDVCGDDEDEEMVFILCETCFLRVIDR